MNLRGCSGINIDVVHLNFCVVVIVVVVGVYVDIIVDNDVVVCVIIVDNIIVRVNVDILLLIV